MKESILIFAVLVILAGLSLLSLCKSAAGSRKEEKDYPCDTCVRWSECNGVDEECPRRESDE